MADIGQLVGTLLGSLAQARRIADEETVAIAEYYRESPLLEGMSVPRVRVPEMTLELPVLIQSHDEGKDAELQDDKVIVGEVTAELGLALKEQDVQLTEAQKKRFSARIQCELTAIRRAQDSGQRLQREHIVRIVDASFAEIAKAAELDKKLSRAQVRIVASRLQKTARDVAFKQEPVPPRIEASIITAEVKEHADAGNVARLRVVLKEEGLEWDVIDHADGTTSRRLSPE
jgi:hypothetical protein